MRSAGVGAFWSKGHPFNVSMPLQGDVQTNNRAELMAVVMVAEVELRPVEVRTDSAYARNGVVKNMAVWKEKASTRKGRPLCNADLWQ